MMRGSGSVRRQPAIGSCCKHRHARQTCAASTRPMNLRSNNRHSSPLHAQPRSLVTGHHQERTFLAEQDRFRLSAASPALDSSGGDEPPIVHNTKAVGEGDNDGSDNNSAKDIDSILAKARQPGTQALTLNARHDHNTDDADCRPVAAQASSQQTCRFVAATHDANLSFSVQACNHNQCSLSYCRAYFCLPACITRLVACKLLVCLSQGCDQLCFKSHLHDAHECMCPAESHGYGRFLCNVAGQTGCEPDCCRLWLQPQASIPDPTTADTTLFAISGAALGCCLLLWERLAICCLVHNPAGCFSKGSPVHIRRASMAEAGVHTPSRQSVQASAGLQEPHAGQSKVPNGAGH